MKSLHDPFPTPNVSPLHCTCCDDCGWLPNPYSGGAADYFPCPCCQNSEARWTTEDCLPLAAVDRKSERDEITSAESEDHAA